MVNIATSIAGVIKDIEPVCNGEKGCARAKTLGESPMGNGRNGEVQDGKEATLLILIVGVLGS
eukprot:4836952-Amphidinium_carterae.1